MSTIAVPEATTAPMFKSAHFIGVGGAGMSGIALVLHERGFTVTGSDLKTSRYVRQLTRSGVNVHVGHKAATIDEVKPDVVVVSTAIPETNPELMRARWYARQDDDLFYGCDYARPHGARPELFDRRCR